MGWAAAHLAVALAAHLPVTPLPAWPVGALLLWLVGNLYFGVLVVCALGVVCGVRWLQALVAVGVSRVAISLDTWVYKVMTFSPYLTVI